MDEEQECLKEEQQKWLLEAKALQIYKEKAEKWATAGNFTRAPTLARPGRTRVRPFN